MAEKIIAEKIAERLVWAVEVLAVEAEDSFSISHPSQARRRELLPD